MSNPILDTAVYFQRKQNNNNNTHVRDDDQQHQEDQQDQPNYSSDLNSSKPRSNHSDKSNTNDTYAPDNNGGNSSSNNTTSQWFRSLNPILLLSPTTGNNTQGLPTTAVNDLDDDSIMNDRDTFELVRKRPVPAVSVSVPSSPLFTVPPSFTSSSFRTHKQRLLQRRSLRVYASDSGAIHGRSEEDPLDENIKPIVTTKEEERLPSAYDLENDHINPLNEAVAHLDNNEESVYFTRPFNLAHIRPLVHTNPTTGVETTNQQGSGTGLIRDKWGKTVDKLKLIAHLPQSNEASHALPPPKINLGPSHTLATYYPPAFDPIFASFAKDEYGRNLPPILLQCIYVTVIDSEFLYRNNQWVFRVELQYGDVKWIIRRSITDFVSLHFKLKVKSQLYDYVPDPPVFPNQLSNLLYSARSTIGLYQEANSPSQPPATPSLTEEESATVPPSPLNKSSKAALNRRSALAHYLRELLLRAHVTVSYDICEFLELSAISIVQDMGWKGKEGYMRNRINYVSPRCCQLWRSSRWSTEWILLRDSYLAFCTDTASHEPTDVLLFDHALEIETFEPRVYLGSYRISVSNESRRIEIKGTKRETDQWLESIKKVQNESPWVKQHRFGSFAPVRNNAKVKWFVDAENHFNAVAEAILSAKSEIYIEDWWLTPELYLRRPPEENEEFRLDRLLLRKAVEGVKIYIVVYKEMSLALTINSAHTKQWLQHLHPNIIVQRHPDHSLSSNDSVLFWSHHEKIVVVDNRLAFIGGLDLCFGRYDTHAHSLSDYNTEDSEQEIWPGQDYSNPRIKDFMDVSRFDKTLVDRKTTARMPWHDVTLGVVGPIARDISRHFIQRWNFLKSTKSMHRHTVPFLLPKGEYVATRDESDFNGSCKVQLLRSSARWSSGIEREHSIYNAYMECIAHSKHFIYIENQFFISTTQEDKLLRNQLAQALVERIKRAHDKGDKFRVYVMMPLIPAFEGDLASSEASSARNVMHFQYLTISRGASSIIGKLKAYGIDPDQYISWFSLRNYEKLKTSKASQPPAASLSNHSERASSPPRPRTETHLSPDSNTSTISAKDTHSTKFKNPFDDNNLSGISTKSFATTASTLPPLDNHESRRGSSQSTTESEPDDGRLDYVSEILYIHDKLMIIDDRIVVMGSANINDRSLLGNRDSEVAMIIEDKEMVPSFMNGQEFQASKFAHTLRMQLWKEHLGLLNFENWSQLLEDENIESESANTTNNNNNNTTTDTDTETDNETETETDTTESKRQNVVEALNILQGLRTPPSHNRHSHIRIHNHIQNHYHNRLSYPILTRSVNNEQDIKSIEADKPVKMLDRASRTFSFYDTFKHHDTKRYDAAALDPLSDHFYHQIWVKQAIHNTSIYRQLFRCVPDDSVHTYAQHRRFIPDIAKVKYGHVADPSLSEQDIVDQLDQIQGHLVMFPKDYLKNENLLSGTILDQVTPLIIFT